MPACTALGAKSSSSVASSFGRSAPDAPPQPPRRSPMSTRGRANRTLGMVAMDGPPRHLLAQSDAVALPDVPLPLQVLRVRDPPGAPARARRGRADPRRGAPSPREGAARAHGGGARPPPRRAQAPAGARLRGL